MGGVGWGIMQLRTFCRSFSASAFRYIGRVSLARENEAAGSWGQEIHILHVNI